MIFNRVTKARVFYRDISFQNMRVNENNEPIIYNFDMAIEPNSKTLGLLKKTGTVQFMARGILHGESHRVFDDCESVYSICSIALLWNLASCKVKTYIEAIINSSQELSNVRLAKETFVDYMSLFNMLRAHAQKERIIGDLRPKNTMKKDLFKCWINL